MNKQLQLLALGVALLLGSAVYLAVHSSPLQSQSIANFSASATVKQQWQDFITTYHKKFASPEEESYRFTVFCANIDLINSDPSDTLGITPFTDLTHDEFTSIYLGLQVKPGYDIPHRNPHIDLIAPCQDDFSLSINWVTRGAVTSVKDQGQCGSGWAFSVAASIESALIVKGKENKSIDLSEQYLMNCSYESQGCKGGSIPLALQFVSNCGIPKSSGYQAYSASKDECDYKNINKQELLPVGFYNQLPYECIGDLKLALQRNPVAISVDASGWMLYKKGVYSGCQNIRPNLNHGALLVGIENNNTYIVKNSWGTGWGENGYIRINISASCGVAQSAFYPYT